VAVGLNTHYCTILQHFQQNTNSGACQHFIIFIIYIIIGQYQLVTHLSPTSGFSNQLQVVPLGPLAIYSQRQFIVHFDLAWQPCFSLMFIAGVVDETPKMSRLKSRFLKVLILPFSHSLLLQITSQTHTYILIMHYINPIKQQEVFQIFVNVDHDH